MLEKLLPAIDEKELEGRPVDLSKKDGDPRKTQFFVWQLHAHRDAVKIWQKFRLMVGVDVPADKSTEASFQGHSLRRKKDETAYERRKHFAPEHMATVMAGVQALGQMLQVTGHLNADQIREIEKVALIHDAGKELEFLLVNAGLNGDSREKYEEILNKISTDQPEIDQQIRALLETHWVSLEPSQPKGKRAQVAYDLAGEINELRLRGAGVVSDNLLWLQKMVGHASCPETESWISRFETLGDEEKTQVIQMLIIHYIDDIVTDPNVINPTITADDQNQRFNALDRRCTQNEKNNKYAEYNQAWTTDQRNMTNETAFEMQRRVGHMVEGLLAQLLGIDDPLTLPQLINDKIVQNIQDFWRSLEEKEVVAR